MYGLDVIKTQNDAQTVRECVDAVIAGNIVQAFRIMVANPDLDWVGLWETLLAQYGAEASEEEDGYSA